MTDDNEQAGYFHEEHIREEVPGLVARHDHLVRALQETEDPAMRSDLAQELRRVSQQIAELTTPENDLSDFEPPQHRQQEQLQETQFQEPPLHQPNFHEPQPDEQPPPDQLDDQYYAPSSELRFNDPPQQGEPTSEDFDHETIYEDAQQLEDLDDHFSAITSAIEMPAAPVDDIHPAFATAPTPPPDGFAPPVEEPTPEPDHQAFAQHPQDSTPAAQHPPEHQPPENQPVDHQPEQPGLGQFQQPFDYGSTEASMQQTNPASLAGPPPSSLDPAPHPRQPIEQQGFATDPAPQRPIARPPVPFDPTSDKGPAAPIESEATASSLLGGNRSIQPSGMVLAVVGVCLVLLAGLLWFGGSDRSEGTAVESVDPASPTSAALPQDVGDVAAIVSNVRAVLTGLGLSSVVVDHRDGVIHVGGPVPSQADYDAAANAARAVSGGFPIDTSALVPMGAAADTPAPAPDASGRPEALQSELNRILAGNPLIFESGQASISALHQRVLNNVVSALSAYPGFSVTIAGYTDELGDDATNEGLSLARAESVKQYLIAQGLPAESFDVQARGEAGTTGSAGLAGLERRVEFEVNGGAPPADESVLRIAIVAPSASNDLAFTQSMVDAVNRLSGETSIELSVTDNTFVPDEAAAAVRSYAEQGFDLVIAHGSQFGASLIDIAPQFPETAFAWGTASDTFGLPNVYAYDAAAQQGGYLLGALASMVSGSKSLGVVGPIEVGDAALFVNGFQAGAKAQTPSANVLVTYTGSFSDTALATETAQAHIGAGADVLTGSAQMVVGAVSAAEQAGALWFGTQSNQTSLAPGSVVASQVYKWEVALRPIVQDLRAGRLSGTTYTADLANGGLVIEYNPGVPVAPEVTQRIDQLTAEIVNGSLVPPG